MTAHAMSRALVALAVAGCAPALHEPRPVAALAPGRAHGRSAGELVRAADAAWASRGQAGQAALAEGMYLDAAAADERRVDGLLGAMRALTFRIEHEAGAPRGELAERAVELGQWCQRRDPGSAECDYRLAIALGQQARERTSTGQDALGKIVALLRRTIARAPALESAGPHRVLAMVLLRAPSWPIGPGDPEAALGEAREAVRRFPDAADNQLALADALAGNDQPSAAHAAYAQALALARRAREAGELEAPRWITEAEAGLERTVEP